MIGLEVSIEGQYRYSLLCLSEDNVSTAAVQLNAGRGHRYQYFCNDVMRALKYEVPFNMANVMT